MKRRTSKKKTTLRRTTRKKRKPRLDPRVGLVELPGVAGKTVDEFLVASSSDDAGIDIFFDDQSGVSFDFVTELKMKVTRTDGGKADIWRPVRRWSKPMPSCGKKTSPLMALISLICTDQFWLWLDQCYLCSLVGRFLAAERASSQGVG
jgi:hypothetical protein